MKFWTLISLLVLLCSLLFGCRKEQPAKAEANREVKQTEEFVNALHAGNFSMAAEQFDATMAEALPAEKLEQTWQALEAQVGPFTRQLNSRTEEVSENGRTYQSVMVTCEFEREKVDVKTVYDSTGKIAGLWFLPGSQ